MGKDPQTPGWAEACEAAFARRLAQPGVFAAWLVEADGRPVSSGVGWIEEHLPSPGAFDGRGELGGASMAWTASAGAAPGLGFATPR